MTLMYVEQLARQHWNEGSISVGPGGTWNSLGIWRLGTFVEVAVWTRMMVVKVR